MGGEKPFLFYGGSSDSGSPPRGRGKAHGCGLLLVGDRITPAWAGKRLTRPAMTGTPWDHPRVGGEKGSYRWVIKSVKGSPPHKRGKVDVLFGGLVDGRITPAQAGKSWEEWRLRFR